MKISFPENLDINSINTLIFDWGGVITPIAPGVTMNALRELGISSVEDYFLPSLKNDLFVRLELGQITPEDMCAELNSELVSPVDPQMLIEVYNRLILETPAIHIRLLQNLRKHFTLMLLSNTNSIHTDFNRKKLQAAFHTDFESIFHRIFYSHELGMRKPARDIYQHVLNETKINPRETLFMDDTKTNLEMPRSLGIRTIQITEELPIEKMFLDWLQ